jgi:hypothetical protein
MIKVKFESLDNEFITPRTGKTSVYGEINHMPIEGEKLTCIYVNEDCESPGVFTETHRIEKLGNEIKFFDFTKRPFKITILE